MTEENARSAGSDAGKENKHSATGEPAAEQSPAEQAAAGGEGPFKERIALLERDLAERGQELERQKKLAQENAAGKEAASRDMNAAVAAYRGLVLRSNPLVPVELVTGNTVAEIDDSLRKAESLVGQIRQGLEQQQKTKEQAHAIPAGAPGRTPPDLSSMTAREKINYGLSQTKENR